MIQIMFVAATPLTWVFFNRPLHAELKARGIGVSLVCNTKLDESAAETLVLDEIEILHVPIQRKPSWISDVVGLYSLWRTFRRSKPDVVVSLVPKAGLLSGVACYLAGIKLRLHIFQGEVWFGTSGFYFRIYRMFDVMTARLSTHCLCVSTSEQEFLVANGVVNKDKLKVLGRGSICGVDLPKLSGPTPTENAINILFVGRVARDKGIFDLLAAFQELLYRGRDVALTIVGPLELPKELASRFKAICSGLGDRVLVRSFESDLDKYYRACDILCLPSYREGFGMVAIEASSYAKPVVGYDIVGLRDAVVHGETGLLCSPKNIDGLCDALEQLVNQPKLRESLGKAGRSYVEANFRKDQVVARYADYISSLADCRP